MKVIRTPARKVDFENQRIIEPRREVVLRDVAKFKSFDTSEEIDEKIKELEQTTELVGKIQDEIEKRTNGLEEKERLLEEKEKELEKMAVLWTSLNDLNLKELNKEELKKIVSEQKGFVSDLLESYIDSSEKEGKLMEEVSKLREKPWAGKGSSEIIKENEELKKMNKELREEIDEVLGEIKGLS